MPEILLNRAAFTRTTGTANPTLTGDTGKSGSMSTVPTGTQVAYVRRYSSNKPGFENCTGIWRAVAAAGSIGYIERTSVELSSNPGDDGYDPVVWGVGEQTIDVSVNPSVLRKLGYTRFSYKSAQMTPVLILNTGQSNPQGTETAVTPFITSSDPEYDHIWDFETTNSYTGASQVTTPASFSWQHPNPASALVTNYNLFLPYVGYLRGGTGHVALSMAKKIYNETGRDVYVLSITAAGVPISKWLAGTPSVKTLIESFLPYILANTPALAGINFPDVVIWGQSEGNALATFASSDYLAPLDYKDAWLSVREASYGVWTDPDITQWLLMEPTEYVNWEAVRSGTSGDLVYDYPLRWEGINAVARYTDEKVALVSSSGLPNSVSTPLHYTGDALNDYGVRMSDVFFGKSVASNIPSTELQREKLPVLGGDLDADGHIVSNVGQLKVAPASVLAAATTEYPVIIGGSVTYDYANSFALPSAQLTTSYIFEQSTFFITTNGVIENRAKYKNSGSGITIAPPSGFLSAPVLQGDGHLLSALTTTQYLALPRPETASGGSVSVSLICNYFSTMDASQSSTAVTTLIDFVGNTFGGTINTAVTNRVCFMSAIDGATNRTHFLMGTVTPPAGLWGIYQSDNLTNRFNGGEQQRVQVFDSASLDLTSGTNAAQYRTIKMTGTGARTITLPLAASYPGQIYVIYNGMSSGSLTFVLSGSDAILGMTGLTLAINNTVTLQSDRFTRWMRIAGDKA